MLQDLGQSRDGWGGGSPRDRVPWKRGRTQELMLMVSVLAPTCNLFVPQLPHKKTNNNQVYCRTSLHVVVRIHLLIYVKRLGQHLEWVLLLSKHWGRMHQHGAGLPSDIPPWGFPVWRTGSGREKMPSFRYHCQEPDSSTGSRYEGMRPKG